MKQLIIQIIDSLARVISFVLPMGIMRGLSASRDRFYTGYIRGGFKTFGDSVCMWRFDTLLGQEYISIGDKTIFEKGVQLAARKTSEKDPILQIGDGCLIRKDSHITAVHSIIIGNGLLTGTNVFISDNSHGSTDYQTLLQSPRDRAIISKGEIIIGNNVWLGNNVCVLPGVRIGDGAVIGANSIVSHDIPAFCVAAGIPAKVIKQNSL